MYAKFINKKAIIPFVGKVLKFGNTTIINPTESQLKAAGYLPCRCNIPVTETPPPYHYYACDGEEITCYQVEGEM